MTPQELLAECEAVLNSLPKAGNPGLAWMGRASAVIRRANRGHEVRLSLAAREFHFLATWSRAVDDVQVMLHEIRTDLQMEIGPVSVVVPKGGVFDYFDAIRGVLEIAGTEVFFVDPYLDAAFVSRYMPSIDGKKVSVRLLTARHSTRLAALVPAVELYRQQSGMRIEVRSSNELHDRFVFVDRRECYHSGASFKDGAKNAPALLTQVMDPFSAVWSAYDGIWTSAQVEG
jgi:hypothetical protein